MGLVPREATIITGPEKQDSAKNVTHVLDFFNVWIQHVLDCFELLDQILFLNFLNFLDPIWFFCFFLKFLDPKLFF